MQLVLSIIVVIVAVILTAMVMLQSGKNSGLSGALAGGSDSFLAKNKANSLDAKLARWTKYVALLFVVLVLALCLI